MIDIESSKSHSIEKKDNNIIIKYEESKSDMISGMDANGGSNLRQDNEKHLLFANKLGFDVKRLDKLKLKDFYDSKVYLPNLIIVAKSLDDEFHKTMKDIFKKDFKIDYQRGPLKRIERCAAKVFALFSFFSIC